MKLYHPFSIYQFVNCICSFRTVYPLTVLYTILPGVMTFEQTKKTEQTNKQIKNSNKNCRWYMIQRKKKACH